ncbi:MAG: flagellar assembly protein FliW [Candidatus Latescibacteria bacterium]|nr:flagellar assembly protein FliW [Candidatus Latescibacterota bacterium]
MKVQNDGDATLIFRDGLVGLPDLKRWILVDMDPPLPMKWLQSLDRVAFRVPVADPGYFHQEYGFEVQASVLERLAVEDPQDLVVMVIATVGEGGRSVSGNLSAPLLVNSKNRNGLQMVLVDERWHLRHPIDEVRFGSACRAAQTAEAMLSTTVDKDRSGGYAAGCRNASTVEDLVATP